MQQPPQYPYEQQPQHPYQPPYQQPGNFGQTPYQPYPRQQPYQAPQPPGPGPQKWYQTNAGIVLLLFVFFPVGLYLMWRYAQWPKMAKWVVTGIFAFFVLIEMIVSANAPVSQTTTQTATATQQATSGPVNVATSAPTPTTQVIHYPPTTEADLRGLATQGDASAIHEFHSESVGMVGACPQPKRLVTVDPSITGKQLAEDLLAYFYGGQLDSPCGSIVFAYHSQAEAAGEGYTAGRIDFTVTDPNGQGNTDPNATGLKYTLTLDTGGVFTSQQEYIVNY